MTIANGILDTSALNVLGAVTKNVIPGYATGSASVRQVTGRVTIPSTRSGSTSSAWRSWQVSYVPVIALQVAIANWYVGSATSGVETGTGGTLTVICWVEYPRGTFTRLTWDGGANSKAIADGVTGISDMTSLGFTIPAFAKFRISGYFSNPTGGLPLVNWSNACDRGMGDEYQVNPGVDNSGNSTVLGSGVVSAFHPQAVLALSDRPVWGIVGDSITAGVSDKQFDPSGGRGILGRPLARLGPHVNYGVPGDRADQYVASHAKRVALMQLAGVTSILLELGRNDLSSAPNRTSAQLLTDRATIRSYYPGVNIYDTTVTPQTSSTNSFKTAAGQTVIASGVDTQRIAFNTALRNGLQTGSSGLVDITGILETSTSDEIGPVENGGVWIPGMVDEGTHPTTRGYMTVSPLVESLVRTQR